MAKHALHLGISFALIYTTVGSAILNFNSDVYDTMTAIVVFDATDIATNSSETLGSTDRLPDVGLYGKTSPIENVGGLVQLAATRDGHYHGCKGSPYQSVNTNEQWIALVERGGCNFSQKIKEANMANASGVIIFNNEPGVQLMSHDGEDDIVAISILRDVGQSVVDRIKIGKKVTVSIRRGRPYNAPYGRGSKTSIIFVSLSFLILMIISLTWLIVYYVQRFRFIPAPDFLKRRRAQAGKIVDALPKKLLQDGDKELANEEICPICIENYKVGETLRILPCKHFFHRKCVDPWLRARGPCPMCKLDIVRPRLVLPPRVEANYIFGTSTGSRPIVEVWEPDFVQNDATTSQSIDSLVQSVEYGESTLVAVIEDENSHTNEELDNCDNPLSSNGEEAPDVRSLTAPDYGASPSATSPL